MLILVFINAQYLQNVDRGLESQHHSLPDSHQPLKKKFPPPLGGDPPLPLNAIWKTLVCGIKS